MPTRVDYQQFIKTLKKLIAEKTTTNLILLTDDNHSLWMSLVGGNITSIIFGPKRGKNALPIINKIPGGQLSLDTKTMLPPMPDLPTTQEILAELSTRSTSVEAPKRSDSTPLDSKQSSLVITQLQQLLMQYVGPIANMIVPSIVKQTANLSGEAQLDEIINKMVKEVEGIGDSDKFRQAAESIAYKI